MTYIQGSGLEQRILKAGNAQIRRLRMDLTANHQSEKDGTQSSSLHVISLTATPPRLESQQAEQLRCIMDSSPSGDNAQLRLSFATLRQDSHMWTNVRDAPC